MYKIKITGLILLVFVLFDFQSCFASLEENVCYERTYTGIISRNIKFHMDIRIFNNQISGRYFYDKYQNEIEIIGSIDSEKNFLIHESESDGVFKGKINSIDQIEGIWEDQKNMKRFPFKIHTEYVKNPIENYLNPGFPLSFGENTSLTRVIADFNNDGLKDYCISETSQWSNSNGGLWQIYCQTASGLYYRIGSLYFNPFVLTIQPLQKGIARIILYWHMSAAEGGITEFFITKDGIKQGRSAKIFDANIDELKSDQPYGSELFAMMGNEKYKPHIETCLLEDYLADKKCEWNDF